MLTYWQLAQTSTYKHVFTIFLMHVRNGYLPDVIDHNLSSRRQITMVQSEDPRVFHYKIHL